MGQGSTTRGRALPLNFGTVLHRKAAFLQLVFLKSLDGSSERLRSASYLPKLFILGLPGVLFWFPLCTGTDPGSGECRLSPHPTPDFRENARSICMPCYHSLTVHHVFMYVARRPPLMPLETDRYPCHQAGRRPSLMWTPFATVSLVIRCS